MDLVLFKTSDLPRSFEYVWDDPSESEMTGIESVVEISSRLIDLEVFGLVCLKDGAL